jgi:hypothetical protein
MSIFLRFTDVPIRPGFASLLPDGGPNKRRHHPTSQQPIKNIGMGQRPPYQNEANSAQQNHHSGKVSGANRLIILSFSLTRYLIVIQGLPGIHFRFDGLVLLTKTAAASVTVE